ncbi:reverse transcriptase domain-containing protein [Tanacetum coccineum]
MKRVNTFVDMNSEVVKGSETRTEKSFKRAGDELESDKSKKQKIDEHVEAEKDDDPKEEEMKNHMEIIQDEEEIVIDVIPLATKPPMIIEYKIDIDREELETLWKLVKEKHGINRPVDEYERVLWGDMKIQKMNIKFKGGLLGLKDFKIFLELLLLSYNQAKQDLFKWDQHASNSANPDPMISPTFVEANYEVLESLLRERRRQICSEYIRTKLEYFSEEYDEEREMEQRHARVRESEGGRPSERRAENIRSRGENLPPLLVAHLGRSENDQPLQSTLTSVFGGHQPSTNLGGNLPPNDSTSCVTLFVHWIEDYPLLDGLKMPSHVGSYDGKGDPDNYLHLFEGAIRMQKWAMPVACYMFTYTLKDSAQIWWNGQKAGSIINYEDLKVKFRSHFSQQKKFTKTHLAVHNIKQREGESNRAFVTRYTDDTLQILGLHEEQRISGFVHGLKTRSLVEFLSTNLPTTYKGLMEKTYTWIEAKEFATNRTQMTTERASTDSRKVLLGTTKKRRKTEISSLHTVGLTMDSSPIYLRAQERF